MFVDDVSSLPFSLSPDSPVRKKEEDIQAREESEEARRSPLLARVPSGAASRASIFSNQIWGIIVVFSLIFIMYVLYKRAPLLNENGWLFNLDESHVETIRIILVFILELCGCLWMMSLLFPSSLFLCAWVSTIVVSVLPSKSVSNCHGDPPPPPPFQIGGFLYGCDDAPHVVFLLGRPMLITQRAKASKDINPL